MLVPHSGAASRAPQPAPVPTLHQARDTLASTVANRRAERTALWQDSTLFQDSFFAPDNRFDGFGSSDFTGLGNSDGLSAHGGLGGRAGADDIAGVVVDDTPNGLVRQPQH